MKYFTIGLLAAHAAAQVGPACCHTSPVSCSNPDDCKTHDLFTQVNDGPTCCYETPPCKDSKDLD